ncbi:Piso0_002326 [Millerozyma farinosa CBS 7064]|uniref:Piso0_002326 protein n=1 Tax=Pichia sorbitophila (strain ATCC MYA-4447 / BCRC 22081 / CBS 7064 / NBRC 10061 / NRRL Y-12695) TaxID=559304 RepID=G8YER4_PICSO|nr:Piso0_002326 [Millerozyma farinosa CBS 7064]
MVYQELQQALVTVKGVLFLVFFAVGCVGIVSTQVIGLKLLKAGSESRQKLIDLTRTQFVALMTFVVSYMSPCKITITHDPDSVPENNYFRVDSKGNLVSSLTPNCVFIGNHQIYTDWLFIWFINQSSRLGGHFHIIMKNLSNIPVLGYGMKNFNFMFLSRKWESDKAVLSGQLATIDSNARGVGPSNKDNKEHWPYSVLIYPEGTVVSENTKQRSAKFLAGKGLPPLKHVLFPRVRGLYLTLRGLRKSATVVYDVTCGYAGLKPEDCGEDLFSLKNVFLRGNGPQASHYYIRAWKLSDIPLGDENTATDDFDEEQLAVFEKWLTKVWFEKDKLMASFYQHGRFIDPNSSTSNTLDKVKRNTVTADFKVRQISDVVGAFGTLAFFVILINLIWVSASSFLA